MWCPLKYDGTALYDMINDGAGGQLQRKYLWRSRQRCFPWMAVLCGIDAPDDDEASIVAMGSLTAAYFHMFSLHITMLHSTNNTFSLITFAPLIPVLGGRPTF